MTLQACHTYNVETLAIRKFVNEKMGLPYINVETDYSQADVGQLNTRIAAFLEMLQDVAGQFVGWMYGPYKKLI